MNDAPKTQCTQRADAIAVAAALVLPTLFASVYFLVLDKCQPAIQGAVYAACKVVQFGLPVAWVFGVQRRKLTWERPGTAGIAEGILFGTVVLGIMLAMYHLALKPAGVLAAAAEPVLKKIAGFGIDNFVKYAALGVFLSVIHSFLEEYYWRWFCFGQLQRLLPWMLATAVASVGFMGHHVIVLAAYFGWASPLTYLFSLAVAIGGAYWCWAYRRAGSLVGPWLGHLLIDVAVFLVGYDLIGGLWPTG
jgi:membrane protease YdiL (CAAX protease family)